MLTTVAQGDQLELFPDTPEFAEGEAVDFGDGDDPEDEPALEEDLSEDDEWDEDEYLEDEYLGDELDEDEDDPED